MVFGGDTAEASCAEAKGKDELHWWYLSDDERASGEGLALISELKRAPSFLIQRSNCLGHSN